VQSAAAPCDRVDPDSDVIDRIYGGDTAGALRCLMDRHGTAVFRYCRVQLHDPMLAEDVHQQIFLEAFRDLAGFQERAMLRTWLFSIARHRVLDALKHRRRAQARVENAEPPDVADPRPSVVESLDEHRLHAALIAGLDRLSPDVRAAVLLRFQQGFSFEELAEMFNEKPGTLHARVARAMPQLRAAIEARLRQP
jgi:RNA polymerase sigma-70 factor (ECF subfamily)